MSVLSSSLATVLWVVWCVCLVVTGLLYAYRTSLTKDEADQIFLDDAFAHERALQSQIVSRVERLQPALTASLWVTLGMTGVVIVYYAVTIYQSLYH